MSTSVSELAADLEGVGRTQEMKELEPLPPSNPATAILGWYRAAVFAPTTEEEEAEWRDTSF